MRTSIRTANQGDIKDLISFLQIANLSTEGIAEMIDSFLIMEDNQGQIKATIGIEAIENIGLLRSLVMKANTSEKELLQLLEQTFLLARDKRMVDLYLATNKLGSMKLVEMLGFQMVNKTELPANLCQSEHVKNILTVNNSVFLKLSL